MEDSIESICPGASTKAEPSRNPAVPKFLGLLDPESDAVYLPLKAGDNELVLSLTEYFGGWGFLAVLEPPGPK